MGYYARSYEVDMHFPAHVLEKAHAALVAVCRNPEHLNNDWSRDIIATDNLNSALGQLCFKTIVHEDGSITVTGREEQKPPMNQDAYSSALAPFVHTTPTEDQPATQGGYIIWFGEDHEYWRDSFTGGVLTSQVASIRCVFPGEEADGNE